MMKAVKSICLAAIAAGFMCGNAQAASWQESLSSAASQLSQQSSNGATASTTQQGGLSLSSLTGLLNGGASTLSAETMPNAAGILQYCIKQKLVSATSTENIKNQVMEKLGITTPQEQQQEPDFLQGAQGLLDTGDGQPLNLNNIGTTPLAQKVKTKACDIVLKQGVNFLS
ncbi:DUF2501 domain-containing protein [Franconibacter sp. IITDAS19]|nr:DUF2501 domain-containing protein [Franconibacter sp. IITDAS19]MEB5923674.1 DUF2501 domain-containing protein [Franconibacter daqui]